MVTDRRKKFCIECESYRAYNAFSGSSNTCRRCETIKIVELWTEHGIKTMKKCVSCPKVLNICTGFYRQDNGNYTAKCKSCINDANKARHRKNKNIMRCNRGFVFNGERICRTCDKIATVKHFRDTRIDCRECLGLPYVALTRAKKRTKYFSSERVELRRANRVSRKIRRRTAFLDSWNKYKKGIEDDKI